MGGEYLTTDFSKVSKPLLVEHIKSNCQTFKVASMKHSSAGNVADVLFGGDNGGNPACVFANQTFTKDDFPICLETNIYSESNNPEHNEAYFWIGPSTCKYFSSPTYHINSEHHQKEGFNTGGRPFQMYLENHRSSTQSSSLVSQKIHNISDNKEWYKMRVIYDFAGNDLILVGAYIDDVEVYSNVTITNVPFLDDFRLALCTDDLAQGFKIVLNFNSFSGAISLNDSMVCVGETIDYDVQTSYGNDNSVSYNWQFQGGAPTSSNIKNPPAVKYDTAGNYLTRLIVQKGNVIDTLFRSIEVKQPPTVLLDKDTVICGSEWNILPLQSFSQRLWQDGSNATSFLAQSSGLYWLEVEDEACLFRDSIVVELIDIDVYLGNDTIICSNQPQVLHAYVSADSFLWSTGSTAPTVTVNKAGTYWLIVKKGKCTDSDTIVYTAGAAFKFELAEDQIFCAGDSFTINLELPSGLNALWSDGFNGGYRTIKESGLYTVEVDGCTPTKDEITLSFENCCKIYIPNAFSANQDQLNETFSVWMNHPFCDHLTGFELRIYDLWGGLIYTSTDIHASWDGTVGGLDAPVGAFVWVAQYHDGFNNHRTSGTVTLLR